MTENVPSSRTRAVCTLCGRPASHYTPEGLMCPTDALLSAALHSNDGDWLPVPIRRKSSDRLAVAR